MKKSIVTKRVKCRLCDKSNLLLVLPMKPSPIGDEFLTKDRKNKIQPLIPLDLYQCQDCGHVQNIDIVNPNILWDNFSFETASSIGLVTHFEKYANDIIEKYSIQESSLILEIGSNDGTLLQFFKKANMEVLGIDPAVEISKKANMKGVPTLTKYFTSKLAKEIKSKKGTAKLILANNVYAHSDNLSDITLGISDLLDEGGIFVFEVSYLLDIIDNFLFDTVYHEHLSYHSIKPLSLFLLNHDLKLFDIQKVPTKGGSIRCFATRTSVYKNRENVVNDMMKIEDKRELHQPKIFHEYEKQILKRKKELGQYLYNHLEEGNKVVAYGASTTTTTLMYHFELEKMFEYIIDDNEKKHGLLSPGIHLEVKASECLYNETRPDVIVLLAWQYARTIILKHKTFLEKGGIFVIPLPNLKVITVKNMANLELVA